MMKKILWELDDQALHIRESPLSDQNLCNSLTEKEKREVKRKTVLKSLRKRYPSLFTHYPYHLLLYIALKIIQKNLHFSKIHWLFSFSFLQKS